MEYIGEIVGAIIGCVFGVSLSQWWIWRIRAVSAANDCRQLKGHIDGMQQQLNTVDDERKLHHNTLQEVFDYIDDKGPWGSNDVSMMELRNKVMHVLKDSSVGRV